MPIDENRVDIAGLAGIAANRAPYLGLQPVGVQLGAGMENQAKGIAGAADLRQKYAGLQTELQNTALQTAGNLQVGKYKAMADMNLAQFNQQNENLRTALQTQSQQQIAQSRDAILKDRNNILGQRANQDAAFQQGQLGVQQQNANTNLINAGTNAQKTQQDAQNQAAQQQNEQQKTTILAKAQALQDNKEQFQQRAGAMGTLYQTIEQAKQQGASPQKLSQLMSQGIDFLTKKGLISQDESQAVQQMPFAQQEQTLHMEIGSNYLAKSDEVQKMVTSGNSTLSPQVVSKLQTDKTNIEGAQTGLALLKANNNPNFYNTGAITSGVGAVEGALHINGQAAKLDQDRTAYFDTMVPAARDQLVSAFGSKVSTRTAGLFNSMLPTKADPDVNVSNSKIEAMNQSLQLASQLKDQELAGTKYDANAVAQKIQQIHDNTIIVGTFKGQPVTQADLSHNEKQYGKTAVDNSPDLKLYN